MFQAGAPASFLVLLQIALVLASEGPLLIGAIHERFIRDWSPVRLLYGIRAARLPGLDCLFSRLSTIEMRSRLGRNCTL